MHLNIDDTKIRIGNSIDYHNIKFVESTKQKLGGLEFETNFKIIAHSDGDIILHVICESIIGALGLGDLGDWFSDESKSIKNLDSMKIINFCIQKCNEYNYLISNIDVCVVSDVIIFKDKKQQIKNYLEKILNTSINIKATRFERNNDKYIKCYSTCLLIKK